MLLDKEDVLLHLLAVLLLKFGEAGGILLLEFGDTLVGLLLFVFNLLTELGKMLGILLLLMLKVFSVLALEFANLVMSKEIAYDKAYDKGKERK